MAGPWEDYAPSGNDTPWADYVRKTEPKAKEPSLGALDTGVDVLQSGGVGLAKGGIGIVGAGGDLRELASTGLDKVGEKLGFDPAPIKSAAATAARYTPLAALPYAPTSHDIQSKIEGVTGEFHKPQTVAGEFAQTAGEFAPAAIGGGGGMLARAGRVLLPAGVSEGAGQATKGSSFEPWARVAGALLAPAATAVGRRALTPFPATAERTALANNLRGEGIDLTAGQATGSKPLQWMESTLGDMPGSGPRVAEMATNQGEQFTAAALRRVGENANRASPDVIDNAFNRIGGQFDAVGARNHLVPDPQLVADLRQARDGYNRLVGPNARAPAVDATIQDINHQIGGVGGVLGGDQYIAMRSQLGTDARAARNDPYLQRVLQDYQGALDDAFERSLRASGNAQDLAALQEARNQYRNLMVIEKAATGAGSATAEGILSPSQLRNATVTQNRRAYARGQGDFADLARSGEAVMKPLPNSGTSPREYMRHALSTISSVIGGTAGSAAGPGGTAAGAVAGLAAPGLLGRALMSDTGQRYLGNQMFLPTPAREAGRAALVRGLLGAQSSQLLERPQQ